MYEYECQDTGEVVTLLRPMSEADQPVEDSVGQGRTFVRRQSVFGVGSASGNPMAQAPGFCPCGKQEGSCGA
jgi:hypothetical protein